MSEHEIKGFALLSGLRWVEQCLGEDGRRAFESEMPAEFREELPRLSVERWYPISWFDAMFAGVVREAGDDTENGIEFLKQFVIFVATDNLNTVMKLLVKFLTPKALAKNFPKMWSKYVRGPSSPTVQILPDRNQAIIELERFREVRWFSHAVSAWLETAFGLLGADHCEVREVLNDPSTERADRYRWEVKW